MSVLSASGVWLNLEVLLVLYVMFMTFGLNCSLKLLKTCYAILWPCLGKFLMPAQFYKKKPLLLTIQFPNVTQINHIYKCLMFVDSSLNRMYKMYLMSYKLSPPLYSKMNELMISFPSAKDYGKNQSLTKEKKNYRSTGCIAPIDLDFLNHAS